jgi:hypothetical protein
LAAIQLPLAPNAQGVGRLLTQNAEEATRKIGKRLKEHDEDGGIIFRAATGLDVSKKSNFPGPLVGNYDNKLFIRAILRSGCPTAIFWDETKIPQDFQVGNCFSVCASNRSWPDVCKTNPLAIAFSTRSIEKSTNIEDALAAYNFTQVVKALNENNHNHTVIVRNPNFPDALMG